MKLSEAIMLGASTCKMQPRDWNSCALGAAANAVGIERSSRYSPRHIAISKYWPWLDKEISAIQKRPGNPHIWWPPPFAQANTDWMVPIYQTFDGRVCCGRLTLEALADWVRSVEPACGECNRFTCTCKSKPISKPRRKKIVCASVKQSS